MDSKIEPMLDIPAGVLDHLPKTVRLADWIELNILLDTGSQTGLSAAEVADLMVSNPPDESDAESDPDGYRASMAQFVEDAFGHIRDRQAAYQEAYPIVHYGDAAEFRPDSFRGEVYRFLLMLRARHFFPCALGDDGSESGELFEEFATHAFGQFIGASQKNRVRFGIAGGARGNDLPIQLADALDMLSRLMKEPTGDPPKNGSNDYGVDGIAWKNFDDDHGGQLIMLGQATISEDEWYSKEPAPRWTRTSPQAGRPMRFIARPVTAVAFTETLTTDSYTTLSALSRSFYSIPFDRMRLLSVMSDGDLPTRLRHRINRWVQVMRAQMSN